MRINKMGLFKKREPKYMISCMFDEIDEYQSQWYTDKYWNIDLETAEKLFVELTKKIRNKEFEYVVGDTHHIINWALVREAYITRYN